MTKPAASPDNTFDPPISTDGTLTEVANSTATVVCSHNCPDACSIKVQVKDGRAVSMRGDPDHPITRGFLCGKVNRYLDRVYSPERILTPLRRVGAKGEGRFEPISWDEALGEIAGRFRSVIAEHGAEAILPYSFSGSVGKVSMNIGHRIFHALGASHLERTICSTQAYAGQRYTTGPDVCSDLEKIAKSRVIILWGSNVASTQVHLLPLIDEARKRGARLIVIDPHRNRTAKRADWHLPIRPGTDAALALGMMQVLIQEDLVDMAFVDRYTLGFEDLKDACAAYTPEHTAALTGLASEDVRQLARAYGSTKDAFLRLGLGLTRRRNGGMVVRTIACLPALTGAWEGDGGGFARNGYAGSWLNMAPIIAVRSEDPPARSVNMLSLGEVLTRVDDPPIKALYVYNSNPAAVAPAQGDVHRGLAREDLFVAVHEQFHTDTTAYADIVLPATTFMEQEEVTVGAGILYAQYSSGAIAPLGEAKSNRDTFALLAERLGIDDPVYTLPFRDLAELMLQGRNMPEGGFDREAFFAGVPQRFDPPESPWRQGLATPSGKFEFRSADLAEQGLSPVPEFTPSSEGHEDNALKASYPLQFITPHAHAFINSTFANLPFSRQGEGEPTLKLHPGDAEARGLTSGGHARVFNHRGECLLTVEVSEDVQPGVAVSDSVWWPQFHEGLPNEITRGNVNQLISAELSDLGGGARYQDCLVQVEPAPV